MTIGMLVYPGFTQLDLAGPLDVLAAMPDRQIHVIWKSLEPVTSDCGLSVFPSMTIERCPPLDIVLVPGGPGQVALMDDDHVLAFVERSGNQAQYVTSVCTGSLVLGAAGLLTGYRAACHWMYRDELVSFGAIPTSERVTCDRNRITGAGVTAGIDLALRLVALVRSEAEAKIIQLRLEYDPEPPFQAGSPEAAGPEIVSTVRGRLQSLAAARRAASLRARSKLISRKKLPEPAA